MLYSDCGIEASRKETKNILLDCFSHIGDIIAYRIVSAFYIWVLFSVYNLKQYSQYAASLVTYHLYSRIQYFPIRSDSLHLNPFTDH